jgi:hypothetical protein
MSDEYRVHFGDDRYGFRRIADDYDEQDFFERVLYSRRHDGLYASRIERDEDDGEYEDNE